MAPPSDRNLPAWLKPPVPEAFDLVERAADETGSDKNSEAVENPGVSEPVAPAIPISPGSTDDMVIPSRPQEDKGFELRLEDPNPTVRSRFVKWLASILQVFFIFVLMLVASLIAGFLFGYLGLGF
jgi:hypothetical protein